MMGIVSDSDLGLELEALSRPVVINTEIKRGRNGNATPDSLKKIIAEEALNGTPAKDLQEAFNISQSSISAYKVGATSTASYNNPDQELKKHKDIIRDHIVFKARHKLVQAIEKISDEKLENAKLRDLASVASAMATVSEKIENKESGEIKIDKLMIYAPRMRDEQSYEVIEVKE